MTLYTQALTYAINNIDNLCYYFETEIEKHLKEKTYLTDCTYFTLGLSLKDNRFVPHVVETDKTEMPGTFNYNRIILTEDYLSNIKGDPDYAWQLKESFLDSLNEIKEYDQLADQADTDQKGVIITPETTESIDTILKKLGQDPNSIAKQYAKVDYDTNENTPSLESLITYYQLVFSLAAPVFIYNHSLETLNSLLPEFSISYKGE